MGLYDIFKCKHDKGLEIPNTSIIEKAYMEGFANGFIKGLQMSSNVDEEFSLKVREQAIQETLERLNGNNKKAN